MISQGWICLIIFYHLFLTLAILNYGIFHFPQSFKQQGSLHATSFAMNTCMYVASLLSSVGILNQQGSIHNMLQSISTALCTVNGELCADDQPLVSGEKPGKSSHAASKSTQTFKIDVFTEEVFHCIASVQPPLPSNFFEGRGVCTQAIHCNVTVVIIQL